MRIYKKYTNNRGNTLLISVVVVAVMALAVAGVVNVATKTDADTKRVEDSTASYFALEGSLENAVFDSIVHEAGYEVDADDGADYSGFAFDDGNGNVTWTHEDRATVIDETATEATHGYNGGEYSGFDEYMAYPSPGMGNSEDENWNDLGIGDTGEVPLYVDNTAQN